MAIIIYNDYVPFKGFAAINLFGVIFARKIAKPLSDDVVRHEIIHSQQYKEITVVVLLLNLLLYGLFSYSAWWLLITPFVFYIGYVLAFVIRKLDFKKEDDYWQSYLEQEAHEYMFDEDYLDFRQPFAWVKYIFDGK